MLHFYRLHCPISRYLRLSDQAFDGSLGIRNEEYVFIFPKNNVIRNVRTSKILHYSYIGEAKKLYQFYNLQSCGDRMFSGNDLAKVKQFNLQKII